MKWKTTLFLLILTIGIGAYVSQVELKRPTVEEQAALDRQVLDIPPETVTRITLKLPHGTVVLERSGEDWRLVPRHVRADGARISGLLGQMHPLTAERVLQASPDKPLDDASFGLSPETGSLAIEAGGRTTTLLVGKPTPVGESRYAKRSDRPEVYIIPAYVFDELDVPPDLFRDPFVMPAKGWAIETLALDAPSRRFALAHRGDTWWLTEPFEDRAERSEIGGWINRLGEVRIARFVDDEPQVERIKEWGFESPRAEITLKERNSAAPIALFFGASLPESEGMVYAKRSDEPAIYAVAASDIEALVIDPARLRSRACFEYFTSQVGTLVLQSGASTLTVLRQDGQWKLEGSEEPLDPKRVEDVLNTAADLRVEEFVSVNQTPAQYGLEPPHGSITVSIDGETAPQRLLVGASAQGAPGRYAAIDGRATVVRVPEAVMTILATTADSLRRAAPAPSESAAPASPAPAPGPQ
jgi:hypothetical protein